MKMKEGYGYLVDFKFAETAAFLFVLVSFETNNNSENLEVQQNPLTVS